MTDDILQTYISSISSKFSHEETSEIGYRTDFEILLKNIFQSINVRRIDHDAKAQRGNKPDFVVMNNDIPILYIETKDIGVSLDKVEKSEQMARYFGYANLILTDYLEFRFYRNGLAYGEPIKIAEFNKSSRSITPFPQHFEYLVKTILDFTQSHKEPIRSGKHLAKIMGGKGQRIRDNIREILKTEAGKNSELISVYETIQKLLVHDLTTDSFADMYAQTLVYGLFVARFYDNSLGTFSRQEARDLIPASNPFLGHFFDHIAGRNFERRLSYIVDELCIVFSHANVAELMKQHFATNAKKGIQRGQDQVIHFYEDFLKEYDDELRKKMGAFYTPLPVVQFIVRSVDYLLEKEFNLAGGLANTSKSEDGTHKVQILDPAVGTGTFISDVIGKIYSRIKSSGQEGRWPSYVHHDLLPRLFGFELMMAPYTIAHLKLSMALKETGFLYFNETRAGKSRLGIYLTNSLEEVNKQPELLAFDFGASIAEEAKEASKIKSEKPIMVVVGNPPYSVSSSNKGKWIQDLTKDYKKDLNEKNIQPLSDDYIKFIRFAEHFIEKNKSGIVAMITNNSFLDGIIHRQMRKHLLETFDDIYILDLHGNSKKKETAPDGSKDENVFDIQQGVSINIFVRNNTEKKHLGKILHTDFYGKRTKKFDLLNNTNLKDIQFNEIKYSEPYYFFVPKDFTLQDMYEKGFKVNDIFEIKSIGIVSGNDNKLIEFQQEDLQKDYSGYKLSPIAYRPYDYRYTIFDSKLLQRSREKVMKYLGNDNLVLCLGIYAKNSYPQVSISKHIVGKHYVTDQTYIFPLFLTKEDQTKAINLNKSIVNQIENIIGVVKPENIFDYIYAVLHSPNYREKYKEFLKIDFPRIPYPTDKSSFEKLVALGGKLRQLHLLESPLVNTFITTYPITGTDTVDKLKYIENKVYINETQYFGGVPEVAWNFWIGGYQPAQKWLKDRKNRVLTNEDIEHYQKMIVSLTETSRLMKEIDSILTL